MGSNQNIVMDAKKNALRAEDIAKGVFCSCKYLAEKRSEDCGAEISRLADGGESMIKETDTCRGVRFTTALLLSGIERFCKFEYFICVQRCRRGLICAVGIRP